MSKNRFYCLEACRGVAALVVLFRHACVHAFEGPHPIMVIPVPSATAVIFFFVLSGAVMGLTQHRQRPSRLEGLWFFLRRAGRVYPLYWIMLAATLLMWPFILKPELLANWIFLLPQAFPDRVVLYRDAFPPAWTLHWEMFFYAVFSAYILTQRPRLLFTGWFAMIMLFNTVWQPPRSLDFTGGLLRLISDPMGLYFLAGLLAASVVKRGWIGPRWVKPVLAAGGLVMGFSLWQGDFGLFLPATLGRVITAAAGMGLTLAGMMMWEKNRIKPLGWWCLTLGKLSYPLYISHWFFMEMTFREFWLRGYDVVAHELIYAAALIAASLAGGVALTYLVDRPLQAMIRRISAAGTGTAEVGGVAD